MTSRSARSAHHELTRSPLVISTGKKGGTSWIVWSGLAIAIASFGAAKIPIHYSLGAAPAKLASGALQANAALQQRIEQSEMSLKLAEARSQELERQIDALNQRVRE